MCYSYDKAHSRNLLWKVEGVMMDTNLVVVVDDNRRLAAALAAIESANLSASSRREYTRALEAYGGDPLDIEALRTYAATCTASQKSKLSAALCHVAAAMELQIKGQATPDNAQSAQAALWRLEALKRAVKTETAKGQKTHTWLSVAEIRTLLATCDDSLAGRRDKIALALLVGAGLRRDEAVNLTFDGAKYQPVGERMRTVIAVRHGKGDKSRTVPISDALAAGLDRWAIDCGGVGNILRGFNRRGELTASLSAVGLFQIVRKHGALIGHPELSPHDLRRSFAQTGYQNGVPITQIKELLGHASIATTQRYLNLSLDLEVTASDFVPF